LCAARGLAVITIILGLTQNMCWSAPKTTPMACMANSVADAPVSQVPPTVTNKEVLPACPRNEITLGDSDMNHALDKSATAIGFADMRFVMRSMLDEEFAASTTTLAGKRVTRKDWASNDSKRVDGRKECSGDEDPMATMSHTDDTFELLSKESHSPSLSSRILFSGRINDVNRLIGGFHMTLLDVRF